MYGWYLEQTHEDFCLRRTSSRLTMRNLPSVGYLHTQHACYAGLQWNAKSTKVRRPSERKQPRSHHCVQWAVSRSENESPHPRMEHRPYKRGLEARPLDADSRVVPPPLSRSSRDRMTDLASTSDLPNLASRRPGERSSTVIAITLEHTCRGSFQAAFKGRAYL